MRFWRRSAAVTGTRAGDEPAGRLERIAVGRGRLVAGVVMGSVAPRER